MNPNEYQTQVIYQHPKHGRVLWATRETNEALIIVECIESGRLPILHVDKYNPMVGPDFDAYDDEVNSAEKARRDRALEAELQSTSRAAELLREVEARPATRPAERIPVERTYWRPDLDGLKIGQTVVVPSSSTDGAWYTVTVRDDSINGGTYAHCTCPSWPTQRGRGRDCKHINEVANATANGRKGPQ